MTSLLIATTLAFSAKTPQESLSAFAATFAEQSGKLSANGGLPGQVIAFGPNAEILAVAKEGKSTKPLIAAAVYGKGRVAVLGHGSILNKPGNEEMSKTLFRWVHQSRKPIGLFSVVPINPAFGEPMVFHGFGDLKSAMEKCGTLVLDQAPFDGNREAIDMLDAYVKNGGGLVMEGPVWGWLQLHPGQRLSSDHSGQILLSRMGLGFADGTIGGSTIQLLAAQPAHHIGRALAMVRSKRVLLPEEAKLVGETLETAIDSLRADNPMQAELKSMLTSDQNDVLPTKAKPLTSANFQLRIAAQYYDKTWRSLPPGQVTAHPASADFPGPVTSPDRTDMTVKIGGKLRRWWSTGAYAAPGEVITVRIPTEFARHRHVR